MKELNAPVVDQYDSKTISTTMSKFDINHIRSAELTTMLGFMENRIWVMSKKQQI